MSEPTYTLTLTESQRVALAAALGILVAKLANCHIEIAAPKLESPDGGTHSARAILSPPAAASAKPSPPIEQRDRWARNRKGEEVPNPEGATAREVNLWKTEQKTGKSGGKSYLKVTWQGENGFVDANCFDQQLFPWLIKQAGQKTRLYTVRSGNYLNIVGVRA
jgi:hypothetical protein